MSMRTADWVPLTTILANLVIVAGIPLFVFSHYHAQARDRAALSISTFDTYQGGGGEEARRRLVAALWDYPQVFRLEALPLSDYRRFLTLLADQNRSIVVDLSTLDHWMRIARECEDVGGCDAAANARLFGAVAQGVHCVFSPVYIEWRDLYAIDDLGDNLAYYSIADQC
ncbi:hypothetical protein [Sedimentitalea sp.]|uniref:hypothetical protein n=1 Tax=Sedimentitalea sp. TaxID=2048915 RepID=UPI0032968462